MADSRAPPGRQDHHYAVGADSRAPPGRQDHHYGNMNTCYEQADQDGDSYGTARKDTQEKQATEVRGEEVTPKGTLVEPKWIPSIDAIDVDDDGEPELGRKGI